MNILGLTDPEHRVYEILANIPLQANNQMDDLQKCFAYPNDHSKEVSQIMINTLAVTLGTDSANNFLYHSIASGR